MKLRWLQKVFLVAVLLSVSMIYSVGAMGQLSTDDLTTSLTPQDLVDTLISPTGGVTVSNVTYTGANISAGEFSGASGILDSFDSGIVLGSGDINDVPGPNSNGNDGGGFGDDTSTDTGNPGDSDLDNLANGSTNDAAVLEFDFVPNQGTIKFKYVFTSEEYQDFVNTQFNDVFGFFVNGNNCATVNGNPVSVNTINSNANSSKFRDNTNPATINTEMDGLTTVLTCQANVNAGSTNHMKLAIADTGDHILDANVFIKAESFTSNPTVPSTTDWGLFSLMLLLMGGMAALLYRRFQSGRPESP